MVAGNEKVCRFQKVRVPFLVPTLQHLREHFLFDEVVFIFVGQDFDLRVQVQQVEILAHQGLEKGIQRGNLGAGKEGDLPLQMAHQRPVLGGGGLVQLAGESRGHAGLHFTGRRLREGEDQKLIDIGMILRVLHQADDPLCQDRSLPAPRSGGEEKISISYLQGFFLLWCPAHRGLLF